MSKYERYNRQPVKERNRETHPIWRGIGCAIMLILPVISWAAASLIVNLPNSARYIPVQLFGRPVLPAFLYRVPILIQVLNPIVSIDDLFARLVLTVLLVILLGALLLTVYALMYKAAAPPKDPLDAPGPRRRTKRYTR